MPRGSDSVIVIGIVADLNDPERLGRVRVTYPYLDDRMSDWARLVTPMAGGGRGIFFRPEKGDEVLMGFEHGDPRRPYVLGALWSKVDKPPLKSDEPTKNNLREIRSRSGHVVRFDDTAGKERIELIDKDGARKVIIDSASRKIQVVCDSGDVEVSAGAGSVKVNATTVEIVASGSVKIEGSTVEVKAKAGLTLDGGATTTLKGGMVNIN
jgi:uncharacterized protein involved in type VI secretion and phage assembly